MNGSTGSDNKTLIERLKDSFSLPLLKKEKSVRTVVGCWQETPVAFGGQYDCVAPVPLCGLILMLLI